MAKKTFGEIQPWDGTSGTGAEARQVIKENFDKVNEAIEDIESVFPQKVSITPQLLDPNKKSQARSNIGAQAETDQALKTFSKTITGAINELFETRQGVTDHSLDTTSKTIVDAINELLHSKIGVTVMLLDDPQKSQARSNIGAQASTDNALQTYVKTIVGAINELLHSKIGVTVMLLDDPKKSQARSNIGAQASTDNSLETANKTIVGAINELLEACQPKEDDSLQTYDKSVVGAINELFTTRQGIVDYALNTIEKSIVGSINEINNKISTFIFPTGMTLSYPAKITFRNPEIKYIIASVIGSVVKNVLFLKQNPEHTSINVSPAGQIFINKPGITTVTVIPTQNTELFQDINIEVVNPSMRKIGSVIRFSSNNSIRLT